MLRPDFYSQSDGKDSILLWIIASTSRSQNDWEFLFNGLISMNKLSKQT